MLNFEEHEFSVVLLRIGSLLRDTKKDRKLVEGKTSCVPDIEISFRDQIFASQKLYLTGAADAYEANTKQK